MRSTVYKHSSRSYHDVYNALVAAYPGKPVWLFNEMGGLYDTISELTNRIATDIMNPTTRESAYAMAERNDYDPVEAAGATVTMTITLTGAMAKTLTAGYQVGGISSSTGDMVIFELDEDASSGGTDTIGASFTQKKTYTDVNIGIIDSQDDYMDFPIDGYFKIIKTSISLSIDSLTWSRIDNFDNSIDTDRHFRLVYQSDGKCRVQFGNGTNGLKPSLNDTTYATFAVTKGLAGQMDAGEIDINVGNDSDISSVTNASETSGGNNAESVASIVRNARANVRLRNIVWSQEDLELAALASSSSVVKALGVPGVGEAAIHIVLANGSETLGSIGTTVETYVTSLTQFGLMPVTCYLRTANTVNITGTVTVRSGFTAATVEDLTEFALTMASSSFDNQIIEYYDDYGIDMTREDIINVVWSWAFTSSENDALAYIIDKWKDLLGDREYREWGQDLEIGNLWIMGDALYDYGVDNFSLTSPTSNTSCDDDEIITTGTVTITS